MQTFFVNIPGVGTWQEPVDTLSSLPTSNNNDGDARVTLDTSNVYIWNELSSTWIQSGGGGGESTTASVSDDCALEFYFDCDGTTGWINWDTVTVI